MATAALGTGTPPLTVLTQIKSVREMGGLGCGGAQKRESFAAIAAMNQLERPWAGSLLALATDGLNTADINLIMLRVQNAFSFDLHAHEKLWNVWDKWDMKSAKFSWTTRITEGRATVRGFLLALLRPELVSLYQVGYQDADGGNHGPQTLNELIGVVQRMTGIHLSYKHVREAFHQSGVFTRRHPWCSRSEAIADIRDHRSDWPSVTQDQPVRHGGGELPPDPPSTHPIASANASSGSSGTTVVATTSTVDIPAIPQVMCTKTQVLEGEIARLSVQIKELKTQMESLAKYNLESYRTLSNYFNEQMDLNRTLRQEQREFQSRVEYLSSQLERGREVVQILSTEIFAVKPENNSQIPEGSNSRGNESVGRSGVGSSSVADWNPTVFTPRATIQDVQPSTSGLTNQAQELENKMTRPERIVAAQDAQSNDLEMDKSKPSYAEKTKRTTMEQPFRESQASLDSDYFSETSSTSFHVQNSSPAPKGQCELWDGNMDLSGDEPRPGFANNSFENPILYQAEDLLSPPLSDSLLDPQSAIKS
ncbi:hypothetical protein BP6252_04258 [Coleophoma cylindrospora]|uniref:Uncharacterized protein n=1 Tax=Coleophoma cylindrospora TaxID=1849047 RepID=A0A3D8S0G8_9HELO|nr:hypothetical protein BP6252_04258 [Coleophoma cylindrospora]